MKYNMLFYEQYYNNHYNWYVPFGKPFFEDGICNGCGGKGWVAVGDQARRCPVCNSDGVVPSRIKISYEPVWTW
jgi:hypothetical protein